MSASGQLGRQDDDAADFGHALHPGSRGVEAAGPGPWLIDAVGADGTEVVLVLGLRWHTVLGRDLVRQARRRATQLGASHWVHAGGRSESVGILVRPPRRLRWPRASHAAAQALARRLATGSHIAVLEVPGRSGQAWLAVVRDGRVVQGGEWLGPVGEPLQQAWRDWRAALPGAATWGSLKLLPAAAETVCNPLDWADLSSSLGADSLLQARRRPGVVAAAGALLTVAVGMWVQYLLATPDIPVPAEAASALAEPDADPAAAWHDADERWRESTRVTTPAGLEVLAHAVLAAPLYPAGWHFVQAACQAGDAAWHCVATYRRPPGPARQAGLTAVLPSHWQLSWLGLDDAEARWTVPVPMRALRWEDLEPDPSRWLPEADLLLGLTPIWQGLDVGRRRSLDPRPGASSAGTLPERPVDWPRLGVRELTLLGPLRSFSLFPSALARRTAWQSMEVRHLPGQTPAADRSVLMLTLKGLAYERGPNDADIAS